MSDTLCIEKHQCTNCHKEFQFIEIENPEDIPEATLQQLKEENITIIKKGEKIICPGCQKVF
jgi:DNA-directed RNA polymerase subunit RPC12/RpoP